jgi:hypothetical protein
MQDKTSIQNQLKSNIQNNSKIDKRGPLKSKRNALSPTTMSHPIMGPKQSLPTGSGAKLPQLGGYITQFGPGQGLPDGGSGTTNDSG